MDIQDILKKLDELEAKATKGEWRLVNESKDAIADEKGWLGYMYRYERMKGNGEFIVALRNAYPLLREEIKRLDRENEQLKHDLNNAYRP